MVVSRRQGPEPLIVQREEFTRLIARGVGNSEACREVGINRRTGTRWRFGRTIPASHGRSLHYPPVVTTERAPVSARYLSEDERVVIADLRRGGVTVRAIAVELGRSPSTVSRELRRNLGPGSGGYRPSTAHRLAAARRGRPRQRRVDGDAVLAGFVQARLALRWSPEQISRAARTEFGDDPARRLVPETIYQAIYDRDCGLTRDQDRVLRTKRRRRRARRRPDARRVGSLAGMTMIDDRPAVVQDRIQAGHWEGDYIMGKGHQSAIATLVERTSRAVVLVQMDEDKTAGALCRRLIDVFTAMPASMRRTLTWDQGKEMADHLELARAVGMSVYFCQRASPWQRGSNENMNGLLRDYFPKFTDLRVHDAARLSIVAAELNARPRKGLGWATPAEVYASQVAGLPDRACLETNGRLVTRGGPVRSATSFPANAVRVPTRATRLDQD